MIEKLQWLVFVSDEYRPIYEQHFLPSFNAVGLAERFNLRTIVPPTPYDRVAQMDAALRLIPRDRTSVWSGVDFRFYRDFDPEADFRIDPLICATSMDVLKPRHHCPDFILTGGTPEFFAFMETMASYCRSGRCPDDQVAMNVLNEERKSAGNFGLDALDRRFWTIGLNPPLDRYPWQIGDRVPEPPADIVCHHANYSAPGVATKLALLDAVRAKVESR